MECRVSSERDGQVAPLILGWPKAELAFDTLDDLGELAVVERPDEDQAGVRSSRFGPLARYRCEVATVARNQHAPFGRGQLEHLRVGEPLVGRVFGERQNVVAALAQLGRDTARREVRVKQQAQVWLYRGRELDEGVELVPRRGCATVLRYRFRDLAGVAVAVGDGKAYLTLG